MTHDLNTQSTTYVVVCGHSMETNETAKSRLAQMLRPQLNAALPGVVSLPDPFLFHLIAVHEVFLVELSASSQLSVRLHDALGKVNEYSQQSPNQRARDDLERLTIQLHDLSQHIDAMSFKADIAEVLVRGISDAHGRYGRTIAEDERKDYLLKMTDVINHLKTSIETQTMRLNNCRSRRDTATNLASRKH